MTSLTWSHFPLIQRQESKVKKLIALLPDGVIDKKTNGLLFLTSSKMLKFIFSTMKLVTQHTPVSFSFSDIKLRLVLIFFKHGKLEFIQTQRPPQATKTDT
jgi:hypothetical protein